MKTVSLKRVRALQRRPARGFTLVEMIAVIVLLGIVITVVSGPIMSHHLRLLAEVGLIEMRRDGQYAHYRLRTDVVEAYVSTLEMRLRVRSVRDTAAKKGAVRK